jgi:RNA polymerase sigma-70 factor (ECF subfamily)
MGEIEEQRLTSCILQGDKNALRMFFDQYVDRLYEFVFYRCGKDPQVSEEIVQETCVAAIEGMKKFRGEATFYTWICAIARNMLATHWKNRTAKPTVVNDAKLYELLENIDANPLVPEDLKDQGLGNLVSQVLTSLPTHYQDALWAKYVDEISLEQMAQRLGLTVNGVGSLLFRARDAFRRTFGEILRQEDKNETR